MSNFLSIATVTTALTARLHTSAAKDVTDYEVNVTTKRPEAAKTDSQDPKATINVYLYQVTPNAALRNTDLPTRRADGTLIQRPQVALDLHYMISFYGDDRELVPQRLLGSVVRTLHAQPFLSHEQIRQTIIAGPKFLAPSDLAEQVELVKFSPLHLSLEELSKIWSIFFQVPYTLSVAYQGTVVLIESEGVAHETLPVQTRRIYAFPFHQPLIEQVMPLLDKQPRPNQPITIDSTLVIDGKRLQGDAGTLVQIDGVEVTPGADDVSGTRITLPLNQKPLAGALRAGVQGLQVLHRLQMGADKAGDQPHWHRGVASNVTAFVLRPTITVPKPTRAQDDLKVTIRPDLRRGQRAVLLLNELKPGALSPQTYSFEIDPAAQSWKDQAGNPVPDWHESLKDKERNRIHDGHKFSDEDRTDSIACAIAGVKPGSYLIRVQVDGAESPLIINAEGYYDRPQVTIS